jgi:hypothetical protein
LVRVALHTSQAMDVVAREKMVDSFPQSRQLTFKNWLVIFSPQRSMSSNFLARLQGA